MKTKMFSRLLGLALAAAMALSLTACGGTGAPQTARAAAAAHPPKRRAPRSGAARKRGVFCFS